jgi:hypothetical protein
MNRMVPRFAGGGVVGGGVMQAGKAGISATAEAGTALLKAMKKLGVGGPTSWATFDALAKKMGLGISSTFRPGDSDSFHGQSIGGGRARATDYSGPILGSRSGPMANFTRALMPRVRQLEELFYDPLGGWDKGVSIGAIGGHDDHVHVAFAKGGIVPAMAHGKRWIKGGRHGTYNVNQAATLAWQVGAAEAAAKALSSKVMSESSGRSRAIGHDPGGTTGYGLWQITSGYQDALINKMGGPGGILIPPNNASAANSIYQSSGLGAWYGATGAAGRILKDAVGGVQPKPKTTKGGKTPTGKAAAAWALEIPQKWMDAVARMGSEGGTIAQMAEFASRAASLGVNVGGKDEVGWLKAELNELAKYRDLLLTIRAYIIRVIEAYRKAIQRAKEQIAKMKQGKTEGIGKGKKNRPGRRNKQIEELQARIGKWKTRRDASTALLNDSDAGPLGKLAEIQGFVNPASLAFMPGLNLGKHLGAFGGTIGDVQSALKSASDAGITEAATADTSSSGIDNSAMIALLQQQADNLAKQLFVSEQSFKVLSQTPYVGSFAQGGIVPGIGPKLATVHGGEMIGPAGSPTVVVLVEDGAVDARRIRAIAGRQAETMARRAGKGRIPGRAGSMG